MMPIFNERNPEIPGGNPTGNPVSARNTTQNVRQGNIGNGLSQSFGQLIEQTGDSIAASYNNAKGSLNNLTGLNPVSGRLRSAGISKGADVNARLQNIAASSPVGGITSDDHRVKISLPRNSQVLYAKTDNVNHLLRPLLQTGGLIFPYTPQMIFQHLSDYTQASPTHSNYPMNFYNNSYVGEITMIVQFTSNSVPEAQYVLACITFLRSITKMFAGQDVLAGNPPPVVRLSGHGKYLIPSIPTVCHTVAITLPQDVDYITIPTPPPPSSNYVPSFGNSPTTRIPRNIDINIGLRTTYSRNQLREFGVEKLANGQLINPITGGFI